MQRFPSPESYTNYYILNPGSKQQDRQPGIWLILSGSLVVHSSLNPAGQL